MKTDSELKKDVASELMWYPLDSEARVEGVAVSDTEIAAAAERALSWNTPVPHDRVVNELTIEG